MTEPLQTSPATPSLLSRLRRFSMSLGYALYDKKLEMLNLPVVYYYDNDVIYNMILGYERELPRGDRRDGGKRGDSSVNHTPQQSLVRSLLSCGRFGTMNMLRPHALELDSKLRSKVKPTSRDEWEAERAKALQYIEQTETGKILAELNSIVSQGPGTPRDVMLEQFLRVLISEGFDTFVKVEQLRGSWFNRLNFFHDRELISFERLGPKIDLLMSESRGLVFAILNILEKFRPGARVPNLNDSIALAILHRKVTERDARKDADIVRFYSHNRALREAVSEDRVLCSLLSHGVALTSDDAEDAAETHFRSVVRDDDYFLMRLRFTPLGPGISGADQDDLAQVEQLHEDLCEILQANPESEAYLADLEKIKWQGEPLLKVLKEFEDLSLMESIWKPEGLPPDFGQDLEKWTAVFRFVETGEVSDELDERVEVAQNELSSKVSHIRQWAEAFKVLQRASRLTRRRLEDLDRQFDEPDPMRDLGLVRWGYRLSEESKEKLVGSLRSLLQMDSEHLDQEELDDVCSQLASRLVAAQRDVSECLLMSAILWALGEHKELVEIIDQYDAKASRKIPPTLSVLRAAARLKGLPSDSPESKEKLFGEKQTLVNDILQLAESLDKEGEREILLGVGYVLYHACKSESHGRRLADRHFPEGEFRKVVDQWARRSYEAGETAVGLFGSDTLQFAFAINHCAYVGLVTGCAETNEVEAYRDTLLGLKGTSVWNSRFEDTLGCFYLLPMEDEWNSTAANRRGSLDFDNGIERAERHFKTALEMDFGDIDLPSHIDRLETLKSRYQKAKKAAQM